VKICIVIRVNGISSWMQLHVKLTHAPTALLILGCNDFFVSNQTGSAFAIRVTKYLVASMVKCGVIQTRRTIPDPASLNTIIVLMNRIFQSKDCVVAGSSCVISSFTTLVSQNTNKAFNTMKAPMVWRTHHLVCNHTTPNREVCGWWFDDIVLGVVFDGALHKNMEGV